MDNDEFKSAMERASLPWEFFLLNFGDQKAIQKQIDEMNEIIDDMEFAPHG